MLTRRTPLYRGSKLKPVSAKRARLNKIYSALRKKFLAEHPYCQVWLHKRGFTDKDVRNGILVWRNDKTCESSWCEVPRADDIHHAKGRGKYLLDVSTWVAVSRKEHDWVHAHPKEAEAKGYIIRR